MYSAVPPLHSFVGRKWVGVDCEPAEGFKSGLENCQPRLEERCNCTDVDEFDEVFETEEDDETDESEAELARERAEWYDSHGWTEMAEREYDRLVELTDDG